MVLFFVGMIEMIFFITHPRKFLFLNTIQKLEPALKPSQNTNEAKFIPFFGYILSWWLNLYKF